MAKYHLTEDGPKKCTAQPGNCPKVQEDGRPAEHFYNLEDAQRGYELQLEREHSTFETISANSEAFNNSRNFEKFSKTSDYDGPIGDMSDFDEDDCFYVQDNWGDGEYLTDPFSPDTESLYLQGQCLAYASAVHEREGWPLVIQTVEENSEEWDEETDEPIKYRNIVHAYNRLPNGNLYDIQGELKLREKLSEDYVEYEDAKSAQYDFEGYMSDQDYKAARWVLESRIAEPEKIKTIAEKTSEVQETSENSRSVSEENFQSLVSEMRDIEDEEFPNHAQVGDEYVTLRDCADPRVAENNCWAASAMAAEQFPEFKESTLTFDNGDVHVALVHDESDNVVDYTMRQFDHESDFPYVGTYQDWKKKVTSYMEENRSASLKD